MAAEVHDQIKRDVEDIICGALVTVAIEKCPRGFYFNEDDFEKLLQVIKIKRIESDGECHSSAEGEQEGQRSVYLDHSHRVHLTVQADFNVRVYCDEPIMLSANAEAETEPGVALGAVGGTTGGATVGALIGSVVPVAGTIVSGVIGGIVGGVGGLIASSVAAAGAGAGVGAAHGNNVDRTVQAFEVFSKLENFSYDRTNNTCSCTVTGNTTCPYQLGRLKES